MGASGQIGERGDFLSRRLVSYSQRQTHAHKLQPSCLLIEGELLLPNPRHMHLTKRKLCQSQTLPSFSCCDSLGPLASASHPFLSECQEWTEAKAASVHQTEEQQKL